MKLLRPALTVALSLLCSAASAHVALIAPTGGEKLSCGVPFTVTWTVSIAHDQTSYDLEYSTTGPNGPWKPIAIGLPPGDLSKGSIHQFAWDVPADYSDAVRVRVLMHNATEFWEDASPNDLSITNAIAVDLGDGKPGGGGGVPHLDACGDLGPGGAATLTVENAPPSSLIVFLAGPQSSPVPFFGGLLHPSPITATAAVFTDASGGLAAPLPPGIGPATLVLQAALDDPGATSGVGLTNAIKVTWP